jgi:flagellar biogenesis protein FliO
MTGASDLALLGRVMGGLIIVIVLIGLIAKVARQTRGHKGDSGLRVIDRVGLSREANLAVVEVSNRMLLLGVTAQGVTMLANLDQNDAGAEAPAVQNYDPETNETDETDDADPATVDLYDVDPDQVAQYASGPGDLGRYELDDEDGYYGRPTGPAEVDLSQFERLEQFEQLEPGQPVEPVELDVSDTIDGLTVIRAARPTEWVEPPPPIPAEVAVDDYPDLATALRAAGRTADPAPEQTPPTSSWAEAEARAELPVDLYPNNSYLHELDELDQLEDEDDADFYAEEYDDEPIAPRTRAEARAQERPAARSWNPLPRSRFVASAVETPEPARIKVPAPPKPRKARKVVVSSTQQASGSVLSPNTWRQGLEALRELTVRRG